MYKLKKSTDKNKDKLFNLKIEIYGKSYSNGKDESMVEMISVYYDTIFSVGSVNYQ